MTEKNRVLIITGGRLMPAATLLEAIAEYRVVAEKIGAELLVLKGDHEASLQELPPAPRGMFVSSAPGAGSPLIVDYHDARLPKYRDGVEGVPLLTDVVEPSTLRRALLSVVPPLSLFAMAAAAAALGWWLGPLVMG